MAPLFGTENDTRKTTFLQLVEAALPSSIAMLLNLGMQFVDLIFLSKLGPEVVSAAGIQNSLYATALTFLGGICMGADPWIGRAVGRQDYGEAKDYRTVALWLALWTGVAASVFLVIAAPPVFTLFAIDPTQADLARIMLYWFVPSLPIALAPFVLRISLTAQGRAVEFFYALVLGNLVNVGLNFLLVERYGFPGSAVATFVSRALILAYLLWRDAAGWRAWIPPGLRNHAENALRKVVVTGLPIGGQIMLETGVFATSTLLAGRIGVAPSAAHLIVLQIASLTFMIPMGISGAASTLMARAIGANQTEDAKEIGDWAFFLGGGTMMCAALVLLTWPQTGLGFFEMTAEVRTLASSLLLIAGWFQVFDGLQVVGSGVYRGLGYPLVPLVWNAIGHWLIGLPIGVLLAFHFGQGVQGLWFGLAVGLGVVAMGLVMGWNLKRRSLSAGELPEKRGD